jgi:YVTN family beta-propeller protein
MARVFAAGMIAALAMILGVAPSRAQNAYITNCGSDSVSVIATATNTVVGSPISVGTCPYGVTVTPDGTQVYVANSNSNNVSAIATATSTVTATIPVGTSPIGVAVTPNGSFAYVANYGSATVSVIATATNAVVGSPITVRQRPRGCGGDPGRQTSSTSRTTPQPPSR